MKQLADKEIRGVSAKQVVTIIICTGTTIATTLKTYYNLKEDAAIIKQQNESAIILNDLKMKILDQRIDHLTIELKDYIKEAKDEIKGVGKNETGR